MQSGSSYSIAMNEETRNEIIHRWNGQQSMRSIALSLRVSRNTVKRVLEEYQRSRDGQTQESGRRVGVKSRSSLLDPFEETLRERLIRYPNISVVQLLEELRDRDFRGGYTILRQRVKRLRKELHQNVEAEHKFAPGAQAQMKYHAYDLLFLEEGPQRVYLFGYQLNYSRRQYLRFCLHRDFDTTVAKHIEAFEHLGGLATTCLYEPTETSAVDHQGTEIRFRPEFLAFASHYGFRPIIHANSDFPMIDCVKQFNEQVLHKSALRSIEHLNEITSQWLNDDAKKSVDPCRNKTHNDELPHLIPVPKSDWSL